MIFLPTLYLLYNYKYTFFLHYLTAFFVYDFLSEPIAWLQLITLIFGYLYMFDCHGYVIHYFTALLGSSTSYPIRSAFRWRYGLPSMSPTTVFISKLAHVCEELAPQGGNFWRGQHMACVEIFGNYEWHYIQAVEKLLIFIFGFIIFSTVVQRYFIDNVFRHTRSAWPQVFIYAIMLLMFYQTWLNTPLDILPGLGDELHDGGQQQFAADFKRVEQEELLRNMKDRNGNGYFFRL